MGFNLPISLFGILHISGALRIALVAFVGVEVVSFYSGP